MLFALRPESKSAGKQNTHSKIIHLELCALTRPQTMFRMDAIFHCSRHTNSSTCIR